MIKDSDFIELRSWLSEMHGDFLKGNIDKKHLEAVSKMVNILYGRKARPNIFNRKKKLKYNK
ncbi:MAG: hypothetical protein IKT40_06010 [Bacilli bacterium]|nr:hypothetical protein [Bacilli bacterium]